MTTSTPTRTLRRNGYGEPHPGGSACQCRWCVDDRADERFDALWRIFDDEQEEPGGRSLDARHADARLAAATSVHGFRAWSES